MAAYGFESARCPDCGIYFSRAIDEPWKKLCISCFKRTRGRTSGYQAATPPPVFQAIPDEMMRRLLHLCHPDKHGNSKAATEATQWLLEQRSRIQ